MLRLSLSLAKFKFKLRNEGSYLGIIWYLLNPLLLFTLLFLVFSDRIGNNIPKYPLYLLIGIIMFNFFQSTTLESSRIILENRGLIKSIKFPLESLVFSTVIKTIFSHFFEMIVFVLFFFIINANIKGILFYPLILLVFSTFVYGLSLALSALTVYFVDFSNIWSFITRLLWFATPIFYEIGGQNRLMFLNLFNPLYYYITIAREVIIYNNIPELWLITGAIFYALISLIAGIIIFREVKFKFAEMM